MAIIQFKDLPDLYRILDSKEIKEIVNVRLIDKGKKRFAKIKILEYNYILAQKEKLNVFCKRTRLEAEQKCIIKLLKI